MADRSGNPRHDQEHENEAHEDKIFNSSMVVSEVETSAAPASPKQSDITEASTAGRKPVEL